MRRTIGLVGMPGSGKSTALEIARSFTPPPEVITMGDVIREEVKKRNLPPDSAHLGKIAKELRAAEGPQVVARRCLHKILDAKSEIVIIDGIRSDSEVDVFRKEVKLILIAVITPENLRHKWLMARGRNDDSTSIEIIIARDQREIDFGVGKVIDRADHKIMNTGTIEDLKAACQQVFMEIIEND